MAMTQPHSHSSQQHLVLIDGYGFVFRAYHSLPPLTRPDGTPVGAVYGFTNMLMKLLLDMHADHIAVIFDAGSKTFRNTLYDAYKANRPPAPDDLIPQFPLVREAAEALNLPIVEKVGFEADDLIATYVREAKAAGVRVTIVSSDKDLMQLVDEQVTLFDAMKNKTIGIAEVNEKFGVPPEQVLDVLSLMGDSSDNIPGIPGIGPKTAAELIQLYGSLDALLARANEIPQIKRRENVITYADQARLSRDLVRLCDNVPEIPPYTALCVREPNIQKLLTFLRDQQFKALIARVEKLHNVTVSLAHHAEIPAPAAPATKPCHIIAQENELAAFIKKAWAKGSVALEWVWDDGKCIGIAANLAPNDNYYIPLATTELTPNAVQTNLFGEAEPQSSKHSSAAGVNISALKSLFETPAILKIGYDLKPAIRYCTEHGITLAPYDDIQVMSYVLRAGLDNQEFTSIAEIFLGVTLNALSELTGSGKSALALSHIETTSLASFMAERASITNRLHVVLRKELLKEHMLSVYENIERPLVAVLADMEHEGVKVDPVALHKLSEDFAARLSVLEQEIYKLVGHSFTIGSPKQLGEILFDEMGIMPGGKNPKQLAKSGSYATGADILEQLAEEGHTIAEKVLEWRQLSKLKSTYTDALVREISPHDKRIHSTFMMTVTSTGRLSSTEPNLQNIPVRSEEGYKIRETFVPEKGYVLLSADYSQIELRILANIANIETLKTAFRNGQDIHAITASQIFHVPLEQMDAATRRKAKAINFGIIYGISGFGLARQLGISRTEASEYIERYFERYPGIKDYMEQTRQFARENEYVKTLFGRKCHVKGIHDKRLQSFAERAAINAPLQGTAADIIKRAMVRLPEALRKERLHARMILQVHDELLFEVPEDQIDRTRAIIKRVMEGAASFDVPLVVDIGVGKNWREIH
jgi:DNA polymerase-1